MSTAARGGLAGKVFGGTLGMLGRMKAQWRTIAAYLAIAFAIFALWNNILLVPLRVLTVFIHEASHALAALATGGAVESIRIAPDGSGLCITVGGNAVAIVSAGYLGSMAWGLLMIGAAERLERPGRVLLAMTVLLTVVAVVWVRPLAGFGFFFCLVFAAGLAWAVLEGPRGLHVAILRIMGLTSCLYALADMRRDIFAARHPASDASLMAELTGLPPWFWGIAWLVMAFLIAAAFVRGMIAPPPKQNASAHMHRLSQRP